MIDGFAIPKNTILTINACGLIDSKRNKNDGCTILGSQEPNANGEVYNDFIISSNDSGIGKRHLVIKYGMDNKCYYLRDLGDGSGTFVRLDTPLVIILCFFNKYVCNIDYEAWLYHFIWRLTYGGAVLH